MMGDEEEKAIFVVAVVVGTTILPVVAFVSDVAAPAAPADELLSPDA